VALKIKEKGEQSTEGNYGMRTINKRTSTVRECEVVTGFMPTGRNLPLLWIVGRKSKLKKEKKMYLLNFSTKTIIIEEIYSSV
jgi:hypothetical protein